MSRVLIVTERFFPEEFLVNDLATAWKRGGEDIEVLTQVPSYPFDRLYDGYENRRLQTTCELEGIPVHRVSTIFGYNRSVRRKILNYLHFGFRTFFWALRHARKYDRVFVCHTAALTMATSVIAFKLFGRARVTIWTQDLWPDAVWGFGFGKTPFREFVLNAFVRTIYGCCDRITVSCPKYVERIREITGRDAEFVPQWEVPSPPAEGFVCPIPKTEFPVFMFAGNLGVPQDLPNVVAGFRKFLAGGGTAELHFVGGGKMYDELVASCRDEPRIVFHGRRPKAEMPVWFARADAMIISLTSAYALTLPGKFQSYTNAGKPIFGVIEGSAADLIRENGLGAVVDPDSADAIARGFAEMCRMDLSAAGRRSKELATRLFDRTELLRRLAS